MKYEILGEAETLDACQSFGIARFGDGELRLATGGAAISQKADPKLARELQDILVNYCGLIVGIPNFDATPNKTTWEKYRTRPFGGFYCQELYGSAFITRPDNAPWIDTPEYWAAVRALWKGKDVALVVGDTKSLTPGMLTGAASVRVVNAPRQNAYDDVDGLEYALRDWHGLVVMCLGPTATVLAARLARHGVHALDLGHIGMFMKHAGSFVDPSTLISAEYVRQNKLLHTDPKGFGGDGKKHAERIRDYAKALGARSICDYGCGEGTLKPALRALGFDGFVAEYDPGMPGKEALPKPAQLLACTDVLEHIEPERLDANLAHQFSVAELGAFMTIATRPANKILPDGRNAHLIQETPAWWLDKLRATGWHVHDTFEKMKDGKCREVWVWLTKSPKGSASART
jgi:hypothetical protein